MKTNVFSRLGALVLSLAMLVPCVLSALVSAAQEEYDLIYSWSAADHTAEENVRLIKNNSVARTSYIPDPSKPQTSSNNMPTYQFRTEEGEEKKQLYGMLINGGSTGGLNSVDTGSLRKIVETLNIEFTGIKDRGINPRNYEAMAMTWLYVFRDGMDSNILIEDNSLYTVTTNKGQSWSVGNRCWELIGTGETGSYRLLYYRITSDNLIPEGVELAKNEWVNRVSLQPCGALTNAASGRFMFTDVEIRGYESMESFEREFPGKTYTSVSEETLRQIAVEASEAISEVTYELDVDAYTESASGVTGQSTGVNRQNYPAGITYHGPVYQRTNLMTAQSLLATIKEGKLVGGYVGQILPGMDCGTFVYNCLSLVSRTAVWTSNRGQRDPKFHFLGDIKTTDPYPKYTDVDILAANDANTMYEAYAQAKGGDALNRIKENGSNVHFRLVHGEAVVVRNADGTIDPENSYLPCIEQTSVSRWHIRLADGTETIIKTNDYDSVLSIVRTTPGASILYSTCTPQENYTFAKLYSDGYIPCTVEEYTTEQVENAKTQFLILPKDGVSMANGVEIIAASNYRIVDDTVVLEDLEHGTVLYRNAHFNDTKTFSKLYDCTKLNQVISQLPAGHYRLTAAVTSGPVTTLGGEQPTSQRSVEFTVDKARAETDIGLNFSADTLAAGQEVSVIVDLGQSFDSADVEVKFDSDALAYVDGKLIPTCMMGDVTVENGVVRAACVDADASGQLVSLTFRAKGDVAKLSDVIFIKNAMSSTADAAVESDLNADGRAATVCPSVSMTDVYPTAWYHEAVDHVLEEGIMSGYNATTFGPEDTLSRAMVVQMLYNKEGKPAILAGHSFPDVKGSDWYNNAVAWANTNKVVDGYGDGRFGPSDNVTLEQVAVILWNYAGNPQPSGSAGELGSHSDWAADALKWAEGEVLFNDVPYDTVTQTATRAQTAQLLMNYLSK